MSSIVKTNCNTVPVFIDFYIRAHAVVAVILEGNAPELYFGCVEFIYRLGHRPTLLRLDRRPKYLSTNFGIIFLFIIIPIGIPFLS